MSDAKSIVTVICSLIVGFALGKLLSRKTEKEEDKKESERPESSQSSRSSIIHHPSDRPYHRNKRVSISYTSNDEQDNAPRRKLSAVYDKEQLSTVLGTTNEETDEERKD